MPELGAKGCSAFLPPSRFLFSIEDPDYLGHLERRLHAANLQSPFTVSRWNALFLPPSRFLFSIEDPDYLGHLERRLHAANLQSPFTPLSLSRFQGALRARSFDLFHINHIMESNNYLLLLFVGYRLNTLYSLNCVTIRILPARRATRVPTDKPLRFLVRDLVIRPPRLHILNPASIFWWSKASARQLGQRPPDRKDWSHVFARAIA